MERTSVSGIIRLTWGESLKILGSAVRSNMLTVRLSFPCWLWSPAWPVLWRAWRKLQQAIIRLGME
jgi:hypothetical protein